MNLVSKLEALSWSLAVVVNACAVLPELTRHAGKPFGCFRL